MKRFNIAGKCIPDRHYMVDISDRVKRMTEMVNNGDYFCINRGRQYGKTTTLSMLNKRLEENYSSFFISFESYGESQFSSIEVTLSTVLKAMYTSVSFVANKNLNSESFEILKEAATKSKYSVEEFKVLINTLGFKNDYPLVLIVDEVDNAGNFPSFIQFLAIIRDLYLFRDERPTFQSVILAGVYDIRNLKLKLRPDDEHQYNSPWNIAVPFEENLSLGAKGIEGMLKEYKDDHHTDINTSEIAKLLFDYTSGYPYMISRLCILMEKQKDWSYEGFLKAVKVLYAENNTLFSDTLKKLDDFPMLKTMLHRMLFNGVEFPYNIANKEQELARLFDLVQESNGKLIIVNRVYEMWLYNKFIADEKMSESFYDEGVKDKPRFTIGGRLNMPLILESFSKTYTELYKNRTEKFDEDEGRRKFIFFVKPIINGVGNFYVESRTRGMRRTDLVIDYLGQQYIIEMKIWHGKIYHEEGELQLLDYLKSNEKAEGYMLTFNFNKKHEPRSSQQTIDGKTIMEFVV